MHFYLKGLKMDIRYGKLLGNIMCVCVCVVVLCCVCLERKGAVLSSSSDMIIPGFFPYVYRVEFEMVYTTVCLCLRYQPLHSEKGNVGL